MRVRVRTSLDPREAACWNEAWSRLRNAHTRQHARMGEVERAKGRVPVYVDAEEGGEVVGVGLFSLRPLLPGNLCSLEAVCLRGPSFDDVAAGEALLREAAAWFRRRHVGAVRVSPYWFHPEGEAVAAMLRRIGFEPLSGDPRSPTGTIDLTRGEDAILASFDRHTRQQIKAAAKHGVAIEPVSDAGTALAAFGLLRGMRRERGLPEMTEAEFAATFAHVLRDGELGVLLVARHGPSLLGALWNFLAPRVTNPSGYAIAPRASRDLPNSFSVGPALWWEMMRWAKARGCPLFDVESGIEKGDPLDPTYEYKRFKRRFSPVPADAVGQHVLAGDALVRFAWRQHERLARVARYARGLPYLLRYRRRQRRAAPPPESS